VDRGGEGGARADRENEGKVAVATVVKKRMMECARQAATLLSLATRSTVTILEAALHEGRKEGKGKEGQIRRGAIMYYLRPIDVAMRPASDKSGCYYLAIRSLILSPSVFLISPPPPRIECITPLRLWDFINIFIERR